MPTPQPYRSTDHPDSPDTSGLTGPVSGAGKPRSPGSMSHLSSGALFNPPEPRPDRIGPYKIIGELGRGGMGVVYLAIKDSDQFKTRVALKVVKRGMDSEEIVRRFNIERQVLAALNHPNIARLIDAATMEDGRPYFVMEYIEGKPIDRHCDEERLNVDQRLALFRQVCAGVQHAHQNLIVHRDLKPSNVLVTAKGDVKLMDFGIAKVLNPQLAAVMGDPTEVGLRVMTTEYASPEQVRGDAIGTTSDVYSLGVLLYELLTGRRPYRFRTKLEEEIKRIVCDSEPSRPSTAVTQAETYMTSAGESRTLDPTELARSREGVPERLKRKLAGDIDNIVMKAMRKETSRRYVSAEQMAEDIKRHLDGRPVIATPDRALYRYGKFLRRNRIAMGSLAAVMLALAAGLGVALWQRSIAVEQRGIAEEQRLIAVERSTQLEKTVDYIDGSLSGLLTTFQTKVSQLQGGMTANAEIIEQAVKHLETMPKEIVDFPAAQAHKARLLLRLGEMKGGLRGPNQGMPADALTLFDQGVDIWRKRAADPSSGSDERHMLAGALVRRGDALQRMSRFDDAMKSNDEARTVLEEALKRDKNPPAKINRMLADIITQKGQVLLDEAQAQPEKAALALVEFKLAEERYKTIDTEGGKDATVNQRNLGVIASKQGDALTKLGKYAEALEQYQRSLALRRELVATKSNAMTRRDLAVTLHLSALCLCRVGRAEEAEAFAVESVEIMRELVKANEDAGGVRDQRAISNLQLFDKALSDIKTARAEGKPCP